jgi:hypothetical protein
MNHRPPDVFLIGVPRAGTTTLYHGLRQHPRIYGSQHKETCYTCIDVDPGTRRSNTLWVEDVDDYLALFAGAEDEDLILEGCTYNVYSLAAPERIKQLNSSARFLIQLRDPVEQVYSNHALKVIMRDTPSDDLARAIAIQDARRDGRPLWSEPPPSMASFDLRDKAIVSFGLARFQSVFGKERVHVTLLDDFAANQMDVFRSIFEFLGIESGFRPNVGVMVPNRVARSSALNRTMASSNVISTAKRVVPRRLHDGARKIASSAFRANRRVVARPPMDPHLRDRLRTDFRPEVERLSELVGMDLAARWWSPSGSIELAGHPESSG